MLNEYFPAVVEPIIDHGGVVNQFQGDAMLVTFNVPVEDPNHADNAVKAAAIQSVVTDKTFAGISLRTRIGINTGEVIAGNVGAGSRYNYTVHGDAVNSAARLEQLNKEYGTNSIISESTKSLLQNDYSIEAIGEVPIRGKRESLRIFRLDP
jgi:adenylate cyclase